MQLYLMNFLFTYIDKVAIDNHTGLLSRQQISAELVM